MKSRLNDMNPAPAVKRFVNVDLPQLNDEAHFHHFLLDPNSSLKYLIKTVFWGAK